MNAAAHAAAAHAGHGADEAAQSFERARMGMWLFLASEIMMFGAFIASYVVLRMSLPKEVVDYSKGQLNWIIAFVNTGVLILSSYTMVRAVHAIRNGNRGRCEDFCVATAALGLVFLVIKAFEYGGKFSHGIGPDHNLFFSCYFLMTGFHGLHVLVGVIALFTVAFFVKHMDAQRYAHVENLALYWHFVDLVWIFLFPIVYLL